MRLTRTAPLLAILVLAGACRQIDPFLPTPVEELDLWTDAAGNTQDERLADLCVEYWERWLAEHPVEATFLGDPRYHGKLGRVDPAGRARWRQTLVDVLRRLRDVDPTTLIEGDRITHEMLERELLDGVAHIDADFDAWRVDPVRGLHLELLNLAAAQPFGTAREREQLLERWGRIPARVRAVRENLRRGLAGGKTASRTAVEKTIRQLDEILGSDPLASPLVQVAIGGGTWLELEPGGNVAKLAHEIRGDSRDQAYLRIVNHHLQDAARVAEGTRVLLPADDDPMTAEERGDYFAAVLAAVEDGILPAFESYRDLLAERILPEARPDERPGLVHVRGGERAYRSEIRRHTSLPDADCDPEAIHRFGLDEVARIRAEIASLGERVFGTRDVATIQARLRTDPSMHFATREEVEAKAASALERARAVMPEYFGILPGAPCEVVPVPAHEEKDTTIAYYREPAPDGTRPGRYYINTYAPTTRPRYEAEVLAYHEAIPGHHLQISIAQERDDLPLFRRHSGSTAFIEGWALYTERLSDEMGLYSGDVDRLGVLSFDAWRACRLVVDTGIHAFGWSRDEAIRYLYENSLLARNNVANEVDRYIAWPGQALAYKIGQREILDLREQVRAAQGDAFSYSEFHDRILENGAVSLATLRGVVERWTASGR